MTNLANPRIKLFRSLSGGTVRFDEKLLKSFIPLVRPTGVNGAGSGITYQAYMAGVRRFILEHWDFFLGIVSGNGFDKETDTVDIIAEKHGGHYHPARIVIKTQGELFTFVANVALTEASRKLLVHEFRLFGRLRQKIPNDFIPRMYLLDEAALDGPNGASDPMLIMLGEWFEGFHEFHLSAAAKEDPLRTILWDTDRGWTSLSDHESEQIYYKVSFILTTFYDPETFEEIFPWHHASGDFVASRENGQMACKLITVRQYAPRLEFYERSSENQVTALILFLANLSIRMRLDRLDGIGETAWAPDCSVQATVKGFIDGLRKKVEDQTCDRELSTLFFKSLKELSPSQLTEIFRIIVESCDSQAPDIPIIHINLAEHIFSVYKAIQTLGNNMTQPPE